MKSQDSDVEFQLYLDVHWQVWFTAVTLFVLLMAEQFTRHDREVALKV